MGNFSDGCDKDSGHSHGYDCSDSWTSGNHDPDDGDGKCFPYSTLISTPQGRVQIGDLSVGQIVWSFLDGKVVKRPITKKLEKGLSRIMEINFGESQSSIRSAKVHSFLTNKGYLALPKLSPGDGIVHMCTDGRQTLRYISSIVDTKTVEPVFNLYTQGEHNFIVDGYVAHNFTRFRTLRTVLHRLFLDHSITAVNGTFVEQR